MKKKTLPYCEFEAMTTTTRRYTEKERIQEEPSKRSRLIFRNARDILVPIALFSSLSRRGLGTRIEGLWGHRIFEFNSIFLIGCLKTKKSWAEVKMFARIAGAKVRNSYDQRRLQCNSKGFARKFSQFFHIHGSTLFMSQHLSLL